MLRTRKMDMISELDDHVEIPIVSRESLHFFEQTNDFDRVRYSLVFDCLIFQQCDGTDLITITPIFKKNFQEEGATVLTSPYIQGS